jgi:polyhydroxybutyrate depolymerase
MTPVTDERNAIVVYPQGRQNGWNAGTCCGSSSTLGIDDVGFAMAMLDEIETAYCVDPKRIYSAGFSAGGMLSHRLACEQSERIAAIGPVAGTMAFDPCEPTRPVPVMHFHGTSDFVVAYDGGGFSNADSVPDTIAGWVTRNGCETTATPTFDMGDAHCESHGGCDGDADVTLCTLEGGGHQWPGGESAGPGGTINMDIFASEAMLDFFEAHPLP